jgi:hypothetical protein
VEILAKEITFFANLIFANNSQNAEMPTIDAIEVRMEITIDGHAVSLFQYSPIKAAPKKQINAIKINIIPKPILGSELTS